MCVCVCVCVCVYVYVCVWCVGGGGMREGKAGVESKCKALFNERDSPHSTVHYTHEEYVICCLHPEQ